MIKLSMSAHNLHHELNTVVALLKESGVQCDIDSGHSVVQNCVGLVMEDRFTITAWAEFDLRRFWLDCVASLPITCFWLDKTGSEDEDEYHGCITKLFPLEGIKCTQYDLEVA